MPPQAAATSAHSKFIELTKKPHIFHIFFAFLILSVIMALGTAVSGMPLIFTNGQPTLEGLDAAIHLDSPQRKKIDLAGTWQYSLNDETWNEIKIPSSIDAEGRITFKRTFSVQEELLKKFAFKFVALGINYECEIYINDIYIGKHIGGYTSFEFEIPEDVLQLGQENSIRIAVSNKLNAYGTLPVRKQVWGWKNYGGILRDVYLLATPRLWIDRVLVQTRLDMENQAASVHLEGVLNNRQFMEIHRDSLSPQSKPAPYFLQAELHERFSDVLVAQGMSAPIVTESNKNTNVQLTLAVNGPKLWSPENPELYVLKTSIVSVEAKQTTTIDQYNMNIGFSSMRIENNAFMLNGNKIILKGIVWHEDSPKFGASLSYEQMEKDVVLMKSLGVNAVRFAFHPPHPYMLNLCSRYGITVFEELPVWNVPADILKEESFQSLAEMQMREMIDRDGHFPCVFAWGIGDQFDSADEGAAGFIQRLTGIIRKQDDRPVYYGSRMLKNDVCASYVDFVGIVVRQSDLKEYRQSLMDWKRKHHEQPLVVLSYGKEVDQINRNGYSDPSSQESQARFYLQYYAALKEANAAGSFVAALTDWRGDRPVLTFPYGDHFIHPLGLLNQAREKRLAFEVVRALLNEERITAIPAGNYRVSFPWAHILIGLFVIILMGYESTNRRFGESLKRSLVRSYNFFVDLRDLHAVSIAHTLILSSAISITLASLISNIMYHYRGDYFADYLITYLIIWDPLKVQFIHATLHPLAGIAAMSGIFFIFGVLIALLIKIFALIIRAHVSWFHVYSVAVWSAAPVIFLSPLAMSLFKIMGNPTYVLPSLFLIFLFFIWTFFRILKGISVIYDLVLARTYAGGIFVCLLLSGGLFFYYDSMYAVSSYMKFIIHLAQNFG
jgi:hypothetical protein